MDASGEMSSGGSADITVNANATGAVLSLLGDQRVDHQLPL